MLHQQQQVEVHQYQQLEVHQQQLEVHLPIAGSSTTAGSATSPSTMESGTFNPPITDPSTQQSTNVAGGPKRKTNEPRRGGANVGSKRPKTTGYGVLFDSSGTVTQRSETTDRVVHNPSTLISSALPTLNLGSNHLD
ncbi:uncharacterized protein LOC107761863 [Nicotiana tabacum]|uniref:Uncharacterized protein LOC107761863 n=1 Tax=Nicotiana tabacum TaxID=4097 RepID=A0AC58UPH2_TOBAC